MKDSFDSDWHGIGVGGSIALDFANTLDWRLRQRPVELLKGFPDLLRWGRSAGALAPAEARRLRRWGESHPRAASRALAGATAVREAIAAACRALVAGTVPPAGALERLAAASRDAWRARALRAREGAVEWAWRRASPEPMRPAWVAALDAVRILTSSDASRVRQCADAECGWFFLDTSRNRSRRWCRMNGCGNRNKARRFYSRRLGRSAPAR